MPLLLLPLLLAFVPAALSARFDSQVQLEALPRSLSFGSLNPSGSGGPRRPAGLDGFRMQCTKNMGRGKNCSSYWACINGQLKTEVCAQGLAFNRQRGACDADVNVKGCHAAMASLASSLVLAVPPCRRDFAIVGGPAAQAWLAGEISVWQGRAKVEDMATPEAKAAAELLAKDGVSKGKYFAAVSQSEDGSAIVQAIAKVVTRTEGADTRMGVSSIISRRALFGKEDGIGGAGRSLLAGLVEVHAPKNESGVLRVGGTPGDAFVSSLYRDHGATNIDASEDPEGALLFGTLEFRIPAGCSGFFMRGVCGRVSAADIGKSFLRFVQPENPDSTFHFIGTCANIFPKTLIWDKFTKLLG